MVLISILLGSLSWDILIPLLIDEMLNPERQNEMLVELCLEPVSPGSQAQHLLGSGPLFLPDSQHAKLGNQKHLQGIPDELLMQGKAYHGV